MKIKEVPQDNAKAFQGQSKAVYAVDDSGAYTVTPSSGWEAEEVVLDLAIAQFKALTNEALQRVQQGVSAPLEYHMYQCRMDSTILAQSTGFFKWQVHRHLKPHVFANLSKDKLNRYAAALDLCLTELQHIPLVDTPRVDTPLIDTVADSTTGNHNSLDK